MSDDVVFCHGDPGPWDVVWRAQEPQRAWVEEGQLARTAEEVAWVRAHRDLVDLP